MNVKRLAYIILRTIHRQGDGIGVVSQILESQDMTMMSFDLIPVLNFIKSEGIGKVHGGSASDHKVELNEKSLDFIELNSDVSFDDQVLLIYQFLQRKPGLKAPFLTCLKFTGLELGDAERMGLSIYFHSHPDEVICTISKHDEGDLILMPSGTQLLKTLPLRV